LPCRTRLEQHQRTAAVKTTTAAVKSSSRYVALPVFSILYGIVYLTFFYMDWAPFRYYPDARSFHIGRHPEAGPAILWYGWVVAAAVVSGAVAAVVPRALAERVGPRWAWAVPVLTVIFVLIYERRW